MAFTLPDLPFAADSLASRGMSAETFEYHHGKHHNTYVTNLNKLVDGKPEAALSLEELVKKSSGGVFNNAAQHYNHSFFWKCLSPKAKPAPAGKLEAAIRGKWGSFDGFKTEFANKATTLFGSGWAWLVKNADGSLDVTQEPNAGCPLTKGQTPLLTLDVWEHAYYIDYRNARPKFVEAFWGMANWEFAEKNHGG
ncbi:MAG TPA: superoxide dismutase [Planctomycetota bacterium]|nr:superoxide dismutase [Planctomycetota bacterium]